MPRKLYIAALGIASIVAMMSSSHGLAQQVEAVKKVEVAAVDALNTQVYLLPEYYRLTSSSSDSRMAGMSIGVGLDYEFSDSLAGGAEFKHAYSGISGLFASTVFKLRYALTGRFRATRRNVRVKGWSAVDYQEYHTGGLRAEAHIANYSVFTSQSEVPFSGFGFGATYDYAVAQNYSLEPGVAWEYTSNSRQSIQALRWFCRIKYRL